MESIPNNPLFKFETDTLLNVRKKYNLDGPGRMDEAIDLLVDWIKKENHFLKKEFSRDYLERCIIFCKGSGETAKRSMDSLCTLRALTPQLFGDFDFRNEMNIINSLKIFNVVSIPKFAEDYHRVCLVKCSAKQLTKQNFIDIYIFVLSLVDYWRLHDYPSGVILIFDYRNMSITDILSNFDISLTQMVLNILIDGFKASIKSINVLTNSTMIHLVVKLLRQLISPKVCDRILVHNTLEELHEVVPKDILPEEYGGKEKSLLELQEDCIEVLSSETHRKFRKEMNSAVTTENYRNKENYPHNDITGLSGTFRTLNVD